MEITFNNKKPKLYVKLCKPYAVMPGGQGYLEDWKELKEDWVSEDMEESLKKKYSDLTKYGFDNWYGLKFKYKFEEIDVQITYHLNLDD